MANMNPRFPLSRRMARSFARFLNSVEPSAGVDGEALEISTECLSDAFKIDPSNCDSLVVGVFISGEGLRVLVEDIVKQITVRQRQHPRMMQDLFANIPSEIIINIFSRLSLRTIIRCQCVRKSWCALIRTREFAKSHLLNAIPCLVVIDIHSNLNKIFELNDGRNLQHHDLHYSLLTKFNLPCNYGWIGGSVDGLLFLCNLGKPFVVCICNPITRDYIELDCTRECAYSYTEVVAIYGFGVSKISGQHKVVLIFQDRPSTSDRCVCHVYTMETNLWRRIPYVSRLERQSTAVFLNGSLHWLVFDSKESQQQISCFDLETELFSSFSLPLPRSSTDSVGISALGDFLCLCDNRDADGIALWLMREYGVEKSWSKHLLICTNYYHRNFLAMYPIKLFKDGDVLMVWGHMYLFNYSKKKMTFGRIVTAPSAYNDAFMHTPSFLSLKSFGLNFVRSF